VALLWWRELRLGRMMENEISRNKAVFPILWRLVDLSFLCGARQSLVMFFVKNPRWKMDAVCKSG
jgi:hypothetical protein